MAKKNRFASQAALEALVRYGPELSGLKELQRTAESNFRLGVHQATATATGTRQAIAQARPQLARLYNKSGLTAAALSKTLVGHDLSALTGGNAGYLQGAGALEASSAAERLNEAKTQALTDLASRAVRASEGKTFAITNARDQLISDLSKVMTRKQALRQEKGAFTAETLGALQSDQAKQNFTARQNAAKRRNDRVIAMGHDATSAENARRRAAAKGKGGGARTPTGMKLASPTTHGTARDKITARLSDAQAFAKAKVPRQVAASSLVHGIPDVPVLDGRGKPVLKKNADGSFTKEVKKGVDKWGNNLWTSIALDLAYNGYVSKKNQRMLWNEGLVLRRLGFDGPAQHRKAVGKDAKKLAGVGNAVGIHNAGDLGHVLGSIVGALGG